jgi:hypothetical protein
MYLICRFFECCIANFFYFFILLLFSFCIPKLLNFDSYVYFVTILPLCFLTTLFAAKGKSSLHMNIHTKVEIQMFKYTIAKTEMFGSVSA